MGMVVFQAREEVLRWEAMVLAGTGAELMV